VSLSELAGINAEENQFPGVGVRPQLETPANRIIAVAGLDRDGSIGARFMTLAAGRPTAGR